MQGAQNSERVMLQGNRRFKYEPLTLSPASALEWLTIPETSSLEILLVNDRVGSLAFFT